MDVPNFVPVNTCPALRPRWCPECSPYRTQDCCLPAATRRRLSLPIARKLIQCPQLYIFRGSITRPAFLFRPASDSPHGVYPRTSLLTCWLNFSQVGLSQYHTAITHWITTSNFIPIIGNPNDSDLSGHEQRRVRPFKQDNP